MYYAVTRLEYGVSIPELSRIYQSLLRNRAVAVQMLKNAARDRGIKTELNWLVELNRIPDKALEFIDAQIKER